MASTCADIVIDRPPQAVFDAFLAADLPRFLLGAGPLPAVVDVDGQTGAWCEPGVSRMLALGRRLLRQGGGRGLRTPVLPPV